MRPFLVCIHDATPAYARETRAIVRGLAPLIGRHLSFGVVPNWCGKWPLASHADYCRLVRDASDEILLHGFFHQRQRGSGPVSWLADHSDEMNGLDAEETRYTVERGRQMLADAFGKHPRGFLAPAWQRGHVRLDRDLDYVLGFFALESREQKIPLATWTWDCGRWAWLGHVGHQLGRMLHALDRGVPTLAIHPRDIDRGFWPQILTLTKTLLDAGYAPSTMTQLLETRDAQVAA